MKIDFTAPIMPGNSIGNIPIGMHKDLFEYELDLNINKGFVYKVTKEENDRMYHYWIKFDITSIYGDINVFISKDDFLVKKIGTGARYNGNWLNKIYPGIIIKSLLALELTPFIDDHCIYLQNLPGIRLVLPNEWDDIEDINELPLELKIFNIQVLEPIEYCID